MQLSFTGVSFSYPDAIENVITDFSVVFSCGWTGIIGANGTGKSTLAQLACGLLIPSAGTITQGLVCAYCAQTTEQSPQGLEDFIFAYSRQKARLCEIFSLTDDQLCTYRSQSIGVKKKIQIAVALWREPDVLVLDEPTNHLDESSREQLINILSHFKGIGILISHDCEVLDALANQCLVCGAHGPLLYRGTCTQVLAQISEKQVSVRHERRTCKHKLSQLQADKEQRRQLAQQAHARLSKKKIGEKDHAAKAKINLAKLTGQDGVRGRLSTQLDKRIERAQRDVRNTFVPKSYSCFLQFEAAPAKKKTAVRARHTVLSAGDLRLDVPDVFIASGDHVGIVGPNGSGKTTLIRHFQQCITSKSTLYIPQELSDRERFELLTRVQGMGPDQKGELLSVVAQLNTAVKTMTSTSTLSPGEALKLRLAEGIVSRPEVILLDEPTNHLDMPSIKALEQALTSYSGTLIVVSHDRRFLSACTIKTLLVDKNIVQWINT